MSAQPTLKDLARFVSVALQYDLLGLSEVVAWGDEVITNHDQPPVWALDLAMASDLESIGAILRQMEWLPDGVTRHMPERLLLALLRRRWISGAVDSQKAESILWQTLLLSDQEREYDQFVDMETLRRLHYREYLADFPHRDDVPWQLNQVFASCTSLDELLPDWV